MELRDLIITPLFVIFIVTMAWILRAFVTDIYIRKYYMPALALKLAGAITVGVIYQFYYGGGDTFNYHTNGSRHIWTALMESPSDGVALLTDNGRDQYSAYKYSSRIWYYGDEASYTIVKLAAILDILTISTYSATACLFAAIAFSGIWALFLVFYRLYPDYKNGLAWAILFVPSVIFWGSGIFKDTITLAAVGWSVFSFYKIVFERSRILYPIILIASFYVIYVIKIYILLTLMPAMIIWLLLLNLGKIKSVILKVLILPVFVVIAALVAFQLVSKVAEDNNKYALDQIANTAKVTAYDIRYGWGARNGVGSGYTLGELDGTVNSMIKLIPAAINVTLFRPYLFEVGNPLMLMAAVESTVFLFATLFVLYSVFRRSAFRVFFNREVLFCLSFSLVFAFAVGISAFNFGTLSRYKLPLIPFYLTALVIIYYKSKRVRKLEEFESTE